MYLPQQKGQALVTSIISAWYLCKEHFLHFGVCAYIARITKKNQLPLWVERNGVIWKERAEMRHREVVMEQ